MAECLSLNEIERVHVRSEQFDDREVPPVRGVHESGAMWRGEV